MPANARDYLHERGVLGTSIMWFENTDGAPTPPESYRELCLSSVTTHDLPPTAGFLALEHVDIRERLGLLTRPVEEERADEEQSIAKVRDALVARGWLEPGRRRPVGHRGDAPLARPHPERRCARSRSPTSSATAARSTSRAPTTSTPTGACPLTGPDGPLISLEDAMQAELAEPLFRATNGD